MPSKIVRVFVNEKGEYGNPVGITINEKGWIAKEGRQKIVRDSGFSEWVFVDNVNAGRVSIFNPQEEIDFAGHALIGVAYFLNKIAGRPVEKLETRVGIVKTRQKDGLIWIKAGLEQLPPWNLMEVASALAVEREVGGLEHTMVWAWMDNDRGLVRARTFAPDWGIPEDEACGSGAMLLATKLGRKIEILHGKGSKIYASSDGEVGGRVVG